MWVCEPMVTSPVDAASHNPAQLAGGAPQGNASPLSMKWVAAYRVAGMPYSTNAGTTTSQAEINLGIVNILVGFAPLKPAEFVVIKLQQIAGDIPT